MQTECTNPLCALSGSCNRFGCDACRPPGYSLDAQVAALSCKSRTAWRSAHGRPPDPASFRILPVQSWAQLSKSPPEARTCPPVACMQGTCRLSASLGCNDPRCLLCSTGDSGHCLQCLDGYGLDDTHACRKVRCCKRSARGVCVCGRQARPRCQMPFLVRKGRKSRVQRVALPTCGQHSSLG